MLKNSGKPLKWTERFYPIAKHCPISPNWITIISMIIAFIAVITFFYGYIYETIILVLFAFMFDSLDGLVARAKGRVTKKGAFLDGITDRVVEFFVLLILWQWIKTGFLVPIEIQMISILFFGTCMTSYLKAYAEHRQVLSHEKALKLGGLLERGERVGLMFIVLVIALFSSVYASYLIFIIFILTIFTFLQRLYYILSSS
ncbi:MAG: hypothetical protein DRM99_05890 [Thermoplasmata archaeon]|nr:MAG: hypothetical protein DRM99_05890 [Thermoplasmata archaeon]